MNLQAGSAVWEDSGIYVQGWEIRVGRLLHLEFGALGLGQKKGARAGWPEFYFAKFEICLWGFAALAGELFLGAFKESGWLGSCSAATGCMHRGFSSFGIA